MSKSKISMPVVLNIVLISALVVLGVFVYFYYSKVNPFENVIGQIGADANEPPQYKYLFSIYGQESFTLSKPEAVAYGDSKVWVADTQNRRVVAFDYNGKPLFEFGRANGDKIKLSAPVGLLVEDNRVLVVDYGLRNIVAYDLEGHLIGYFGEKMVPIPIDIKKFNNLYAVLDLAGPGVIFLNEKGESVQRTQAEYGEEPGKLRFPQSIVVDGNKLIVVDSNNDRIQYLDNIKGPFKPIKVKDDAGLGVPFAMQVKDGRYYVASSTGRSVNVYKTQEPLERISTVNEADQDGVSMGSPVSIAIDPLNRLYVCDVVHSRIMVYGLQLP